MTAFPRSIVSVNDLSKGQVLEVLELAEKVDNDPKAYSGKATGRILASLFYEPSTRTMLSFHSAMNRLGGRVIGFSDPKKTSHAKGETIYDAVKMVESYSDVIIIRHPLDGAARVAAEATTKSVINAGDGANQHPTQTLLDLYSIKKTQGGLKGLSVAFVGDLKYGRTVHSLATALEMFDARLFFVSPESLQMPKTIKQYLGEKGIQYSEHSRLEDVIPKVDILYMTRIQRERFPDDDEYQKVKNAFVLEAAHLKKAKDTMKVMHPLPRVNEISRDVDDTPYAYYFEQAENGVPVRMALLLMVMGL